MAADIIAVDVPEDYGSVPYPMATEHDLVQTAKQVEAVGRRIVARKADVRVPDQLNATLEEGIAQFGRLDVICANAGICTLHPEPRPQRRPPLWGRRSAPTAPSWELRSVRWCPPWRP